MGLFVSHASNHKHASYIIRNSEHLLGFSPQEIEMIALIVRYHRCLCPPFPLSLSARARIHSLARVSMHALIVRACGAATSSLGSHQHLPRIVRHVPEPLLGCAARSRRRRSTRRWRGWPRRRWRC